MSLFAFLGGRHDRRAWGRALFAAGCRLPDKPDADAYAKATAQLIEGDCKVIRECARIIMSTKSKDVLSKRRMMMFSRYNRLCSMEVYADRKQKQLIRETKAKVSEARRFK